MQLSDGSNGLDERGVGAAANQPLHPHQQLPAAHSELRQHSDVLCADVCTAADVLPRDRGMAGLPPYDGNHSVNTGADIAAAVAASGLLPSGGDGSVAEQLLLELQQKGLVKSKEQLVASLSQLLASLLMS